MNPRAAAGHRSTPHDLDPRARPARRRTTRIGWFGRLGDLDWNWFG